jgi:hypothetical protein
MIKNIYTTYEEKYDDCFLKIHYKNDLLNDPPFEEAYQEGYVVDGVSYTHSERYTDGVLDDDMLPSIVVVNDDTGETIWEEYWFDNKLHRVNKPAIIERNDKGNVIYEAWYENGILLREKHSDGEDEDICLTHIGPDGSDFDDLDNKVVKVGHTFYKMVWFSDT